MIQTREKKPKNEAMFQIEIKGKNAKQIKDLAGRVNKFSEIGVTTNNERLQALKKASI